MTTLTEAQLTVLESPAVATSEQPVLAAEGLVLPADGYDAHPGAEFADVSAVPAPESTASTAPSRGETLALLASFAVLVGSVAALAMAKKGGDASSDAEARRIAEVARLERLRQQQAMQDQIDQQLREAQNRAS